MKEKKEKSLEEIRTERRKTAEKNAKEEKREEKPEKDRTALWLSVLGIFLVCAAFASAYYEKNWFFAALAGFTALICFYSAFGNHRNDRQIKANRKAAETKEQRSEKARRNDEVNRMIAAQNKTGKTSGKGSKKGGKKKKK